MRKIHTTHTRDAALRQLGRINRWLIAGSVVLTGVLADVAASAFHGKTLGAKSSAGGRHAKRSGSSHTTTGVLRPPEQPPREGSESEPAQEAQPGEPAQESAPQESSPSESAPQQESSPSTEAAPEQSAPAQEAPAEEGGPVVSGGS